MSEISGEVESVERYCSLPAAGYFACAKSGNTGRAAGAGKSLHRP